MIPGSVDQQARPRSGEFDDQLEPPIWLPEDAIVHLDWVNGNFYWDGAEQTATSGLGGNYDPTDIDANGLLMRLSPNMNGISLTGTLLSLFVQLLLSGCTIVVDADAESGGVLTWVEGMFVWWMDDLDANNVNNIVTFEPDTSPRSFDSSFPSGDGFFQYTQTMNSFGINSFAFTVNSPFSGGGSQRRWGGSINGKTAAFEDAADAVQDVQASFPRVDILAIQEFDFGLQDCYARRLTIFPPATIAADLEALAQPYFLPRDVTATFADVTLLCHFNGSDGDTTTTDNSSLAHTVSLSAGAQLDNGITPAFGATALMFPGTGSPLMSIANHASFLFGTGAFAIEFSIRFDNETMGSPFQIGMVAANQLQWSFSFSSVLGSDIDMAVAWSFNGTSSTSWNLGTFDPSNYLQEDTWYDIKLERDDQGVLRLSIDGVLKFTRIVDGSLHASTGALTAGWFSSGSGTVAWLDEFRITKGDWWYGPNGFEDQVAEFPNS